MTDPKPVRLALLGPGGFGQERARAMQASPLVEFVACYSPLEAEMLACQRQFGAQPVKTAGAIWDDPTIKGVVLSTPNHLHPEQTRLAAAAGKHVFVEKPIAPTVASARQMIEDCARAGVTLMVGHNSRRRTRIRTMKRLLDEGRLGRPLAAEANNSHAGGLEITSADWRWARANCPGGSLSQLGIHHADSLQYLLGPIARVSAWQRRLAVAAEIDDVTVALLEFENGALGYLGAHYAIPHLRFVHILGTQANVRWERSLGLVLETDNGQEQLPLVENDTVQEEIDEFARCTTTGAAPEVGGQEALAALAVIEAAVLSNQRQRPVEIAEVLGE
ncbi:MAG: Gfo/Idh/MocA family oxidoreductase [Anaerolineales bacterium]|nr:Gfo/Idh/MocA family oxidoreductase [Anaerolineales bacterium]